MNYMMAEDGYQLHGKACRLAAQAVIVRLVTGGMSPLHVPPGVQVSH